MDKDDDLSRLLEKERRKETKASLVPHKKEGRLLTEKELKAYRPNVLRALKKTKYHLPRAVREMGLDEFIKWFFSIDDENKGLILKKIEEMGYGKVYTNEDAEADDRREKKP